MKNKLKRVLLLFLCIPLIFFASCGKNKTAKINLDYYFETNIATSFFNQTSTRNLTIKDLTASKPNKDLLDSYAEIILKSHSDQARVYHLYIDYIEFYVYTNEDSEFDFNINVTIENVIDESQVGKEPEDKKFTETYSTKPQKNKSAKFTVAVNKVVANATNGTSIKFDILNTEIFNTPNDTEVTFRWTLYGLEIHAEVRAYN